MRLAALIPLGVFAALAAVFGVYLFQIGSGAKDVSDVPSVLIGKPAPQFDLPPIEGMQNGLRTADLQGGPALVNVFASWCPPCREEAPALGQVYKEYRDSGVVFVGINLWDGANAAETFLQEQGHEYPNGIDEGGKIAISYGVRGIPEKFFLDAQGRIVRKFSGPVSPDRLREILDSMLDG